MFLKVLAFLIIIIGFLMVIAAKWAVKKFGLDNGNINDYSNEMSEEEVLQYKYSKAVVNFKMFGMLVALPGLIMVLVLFR